MSGCQHCKEVGEAMGEAVLCYECLLKEEIIRLRKELKAEREKEKCQCANGIVNGDERVLRLVRDLFIDVGCRIAHGAESGGHLDYVHGKLSTILGEGRP